MLVQYIKKCRITWSTAGGSVKSDMSDTWRVFKSNFILLKMSPLLVSINFYSALITNIFTHYLIHLDTQKCICHILHPNTTIFTL